MMAFDIKCVFLSTLLVSAVFILTFVFVIWGIESTPRMLDYTENSRASSRPAGLRHFETKSPKQRIVIIGSGPTALGAARRLSDLNQEANTVVTILEELGRPEGLDLSVRDEKGFLWDVGVHVGFSHYTYFDRVLNLAVPEWNYRKRASFAFMKGSDSVRRFIPYPVQNNIHVMDKVDQRRSLAGLEGTRNGSITGKPENLDQWLLQKFGPGLAEVFMRKYNQKIWTVDTTEMNAAWVGERVAVPDVDEIKTKIRKDAGNKTVDSDWGPNKFFRYPSYNGTGGVWEAVARQLPRHWFRFHQQVVGVDFDKREITVQERKDAKTNYTLGYDTLISTVPLDVFTSYLRGKDPFLSRMQELSSQLLHTHTHIVGLGLAGRLPDSLVDKSWVYFPDSDSPFYRVTMFSNYSEDHVPKPTGSYWSLMCEIAQSTKSWNPGLWNEASLVRATIEALVSYGFITADMVVSKHYQRLQYGYPVPTVKRDQILNEVQPWLQAKGIYSRGRFGGWRYEVAKQDHSFMQGVEAVDRIVRGVPEVTYQDPNRANVAQKHTDRVLPLADYEFVIAHYNEDLDWLRPHANHTLVYHQGNALGPPFQFHGWERLENVGREAHAYLYHIVTYYDQLADVTVFAQADHLEGRCFKDIMMFIRSARNGIPCLWIGKLHTDWGRVPFTEEYLAHFKIPMHRANVTFGEFFTDLYGKPPPVDGIGNCRCGCFGATREMVHKHPLEFYQKALGYVSQYSNQEEGHYLERIWYYFFAY